ncbi:MAG: hypothetical protein GX442_05820 [Candidatus Riflebacteria bacterium]|nr:hypothetical protein [Candidatus Riflebacteria bacterium]
MTTLRLILSGVGTAAHNMAVDEALLRSVAGGRSGPVLRFYAWHPFALSFGYAQRIERIVDPGRAAAAGIALVRRMTGGRMVFHAREVTFSLSVPETFFAGRSGVGPTFLDRFLAVMAPFVTALAASGLPARFADDGETAAGHGTTDRVHCYQAAVGHSVFVEDRKLIGAAGVRRDGVLAIHGSLPVEPVPMPAAVFREARVGREGAALRTAFLADWLAPAGIDALPRSIAAAWGEAWGIGWQPGSLAPAEAAVANRLARDRYARLDWKIGEPAWEVVEAELAGLWAAPCSPSD